MIEIRIKSNKNGKRIAHYFSRSCFRWMPLSIAAAELALATGTLYGRKACEFEAQS